MQVCRLTQTVSQSIHPFLQGSPVWSAWKPQETAWGGRRRDRVRLQETTRELNIKCDAKFNVKLAARGKANVGLYSDIWSLIDS